MSPDVALVSCPSYDPAVLDAAVHQLTVLQPELWEKVQPGSRVYIKANFLMPASPDSAKTTHPQLIAAVARECISRGASVIVGDSPGGFPYTLTYLRVVYESLGLTALGKKTGFAVNTDVSETERSFPEGKVLHSVRLARAPMDCDLIINIGKCKTHGLTAYTGCVKNLYGMIPGSLKMELHARFSDIRDFSEALTDIALCTNAGIHILDAVIGMEGEGPSGGKPRPIGVLVASENPFSCDETGAGLIGLSREEVPYLKCAAERNLIPDYKVLGDNPDSFRIPDFRMPASLLKPKARELSLLVRISQRHMKMRVAVEASKCIGCGRCAASCPHKAITIRDRKPVFNAKACRLCLCCQELCPQTAIYVRRALLSRLLYRQGMHR